MNNFRIVFVHGYTASSKADWYPDLSPKLKDLGIDFSVPDLSGGDYPHAGKWLEEIDQAVTRSEKPLILVGHSLGTRAVLLYLEKYQKRAEKVFLIAAFANKLENAKRGGGKKFPDFFDHLINLEKIKTLVGKFIVIHSEDDPSISYRQGKELAGQLNARLISYPDRGHFYKPENAPIVLDILRNELIS